MPSALPRGLYLTLLFVIIAFGTFLRFYPTAGYTKRGFDENVYTRFTAFLEKHSVLTYPEFCERFIVAQSKMDGAMPPPTRFAYPYAAHLWQKITGEDAYRSLVGVSALFTTLTLVITALFSHRAAGPPVALGVTALMAVAFGQIHQAQHAMIDGFFTFWALLALWALWENFRTPERPLWLILYASAIFAMVITKENAFFVYISLCGLIVTNRWLKFGTVTRPLLLLTFASALAGFVFLLFLTGGVDTFFNIYQVLVAKSVVSDYAIQNNDGPWYRYLIELMIASPVVLLLAIGTAFQLRRDEKNVLYFLAFIGITFALMASVKNGMNFRYTTIWDMPLRFLAFLQLVRLSAYLGARKEFVLLIATALLCAFELRQYFIFCVDWSSYALTPKELLHAIRVLK